MHWLAVYCWTSYADSFAEQNHWNTFSGIIWQHNSIPSFVCLVTRVMKMFDHFVSGQRCLIPWYFKSVVNQPEREIMGATWMVLLQCNNGTQNCLFKTEIKIRFMNIPSSFKLNMSISWDKFYNVNVAPSLVKVSLLLNRTLYVCFSEHSYTSSQCYKTVFKSINSILNMDTLMLLKITFV